MANKRTHKNNRWIALIATTIILFTLVWPAEIQPGYAQTTPASSATMLVVDVSGSMGDSWQGGIKIESAKSAANQVINMIEQEKLVAGMLQRVGVATFTTDARLELGLTSDYNQARAVISSLQPQNRTNIGAGLLVANEALLQATINEAKIIILLSDGMSNAGLSDSEILSGPVQDAANAGTCIYTVGFGDPGDLDEELLRNIAAGSGCGQYYYATDFSALESIYILIHHQTIGTVLGQFSGTIAQGDTIVAGSVNVPPSQDQLAVTLWWPGSKLSLELIDPLGKTIAPTDPNVSLQEYLNMLYMIVDWPTPGNWQMKVTGVEVPYGTTIYDTIASSRTGILPTLTPTLAPVNTPVPLPTSPPPPTTDQGHSSIWVVLVILAIAGMGVYVYALQVRKTKPAGAGRAGGGAAIAKIMVMNGPRAGQLIPLGTQPFGIGRGPLNALQLTEDASVSRQHAIIRYAEGRWFIQDQGSKSGTYVNNRPVNALVLNPGDQIRIGGTVLVFQG